MFKRFVIGFILLALAEFGFAMTFITGHVLTREYAVSEVVLAFCRFAIAGSTMFAVALVTPRGRATLFAPTARDFRAMLWLGPVGTSLMAWCVFAGCARVNVANASMADALTPLMIFTVAAIKSRRILPGELFGLVCGFVGSLLVVQIVRADGLALSAYSAGDFCILLAAATWGVYTVCGRPLVRRIGSSAFTTWTMLIGTVALALVLPFVPTTWPNDARSWTFTCALAFVSTLMPFWAWNAAQKFLPISVISVSAYFAPVVTAAIAVVTLDEAISALQWTGMALIVASATVETGRQSQSTKHLR